MRPQNQTVLPKSRPTSTGILTAMIITLSALLAVFSRPGGPPADRKPGN